MTDADWREYRRLTLWLNRWDILKTFAIVIGVFLILIGVPALVILVPAPCYWKEAKRLKKDDADIVRLLGAGEYTEAAKKINTLEWT